MPNPVEILYNIVTRGEAELRRLAGAQVQVRQNVEAATPALQAQENAARKTASSLDAAAKSAQNLSSKSVDPKPLEQYGQAAEKAGSSVSVLGDLVEQSADRGTAALRESKKALEDFYNSSAKAPRGPREGVGSYDPAKAEEGRDEFRRLLNREIQQAELGELSGIARISAKRGQYVSVLGSEAAELEKINRLANLENDASIAKQGRSQELAEAKQIEAARQKVIQLEQELLSPLQRIEAERQKLLSLAGKDAELQQRINAVFDQRAKKEATGANRTAFGANIRQAIQNPLQSIGQYAGDAADALGPVGVAAFAVGAALGVAAKAALDLVRNSALAAHELENTALRLGIAETQAEKLSAASKIAGVSFGSLEASSRFIANALEDPAGAGKKTADAIRAIGINLFDAGGKARDEGAVLLNVLEHLSKISSTSERVAEAQRILGRGSKEILPLILNYGALLAAVEQLHVGMDSELNPSLAKTDEEFNRLSVAFGQFKKELAAKIAPIVVPIVMTLADELGRDHSATSHGGGFVGTGLAIVDSLGGFVGPEIAANRDKARKDAERDQTQRQRDLLQKELEASQTAKATNDQALEQASPAQRTRLLADQSANSDKIAKLQAQIKAADKKLEGLKPEEEKKRPASAAIFGGDDLALSILSPKAEQDEKRRAAQALGTREGIEAALKDTRQKIADDQAHLTDSRTNPATGQKVYTSVGQNRIDTEADLAKQQATVLKLQASLKALTEGPATTKRLEQEYLDVLTKEYTGLEKINEKYDSRIRLLNEAGLAAGRAGQINLAWIEKARAAEKAQFAQQLALNRIQNQRGSATTIFELQRDAERSAARGKAQIAKALTNASGGEDREDIAQKKTESDDEAKTQFEIAKRRIADLKAFQAEQFDINHDEKARDDRQKQIRDATNQARYALRKALNEAEKQERLDIIALDKREADEKLKSDEAEIARVRERADLSSASHRVISEGNARLDVANATTPSEKRQAELRGDAVRQADDLARVFTDVDRTEQDIARVEKDATKSKKDAEEEIRKLRQEEYKEVSQAEDDIAKRRFDAEEKLADERKKELEDFKSQAGSFLDAIQSRGARGVGDYFKGVGQKIERQLFENLAGLAYPQIKKFLPTIGGQTKSVTGPDGQPHQELTTLGKLLAGITPFAAKPEDKLEAAIDRNANDSLEVLKQIRDKLNPAAAKQATPAQVAAPAIPQSPVFAPEAPVPSAADKLDAAETLRSAAIPSQSLEFRANGGPLRSKQLTVVGEKGAELFIPEVAGSIVPNHMLQGLRFAADGAYDSSTTPPSKPSTSMFSTGLIGEEAKASLGLASPSAYTRISRTPVYSYDAPGAGESGAQNFGRIFLNEATDPKQSSDTLRHEEIHALLRPVLTDITATGDLARYIPKIRADLTLHAPGLYGNLSDASAVTEGMAYAVQFHGIIPGLNPEESRAFRLQVLNEVGVGQNRPDIAKRIERVYGPQDNQAADSDQEILKRQGVTLKTHPDSGSLNPERLYHMLTANLPRFADGGYMRRGMDGIAGERGREVFLPETMRFAADGAFDPATLIPGLPYALPKAGQPPDAQRIVLTDEEVLRKQLGQPSDEQIADRVKRFAGSAWKQVDPRGLLELLRPVTQQESLRRSDAFWANSVAEFHKAATDPTFVGTVGHALGSIPFIGQPFSTAAEQIKKGDIAGAFGTGVGAAAPFVGPRAVSPEMAEIILKTGADFWADEEGAMKVPLGRRADVVDRHTRSGGQGQGMNWISPHKRLAIYQRDGFECAYCRKNGSDGPEYKLTLDHIVPHGEGGSNEATNLITSCHRCNSSRGNSPLAKFAHKVPESINPDVTPQEILKTVRTQARKSIDPASAKKTIEENGGFSAAMKQYYGRLNRKDAVTPDLTQRANGGPLRPGEKAVAGELGPELYFPAGKLKPGPARVLSSEPQIVGAHGPEIINTPGGSIIPNHMLRFAAGGAGDTSSIQAALQAGQTPAFAQGNAFSDRFPDYLQALALNTQASNLNTQASNLNTQASAAQIEALTGQPSGISTGPFSVTGVTPNIPAATPSPAKSADRSETAKAPAASAKVSDTITSSASAQTAKLAASISTFGSEISRIVPSGGASNAVSGAGGVLSGAVAIVSAAQKAEATKAASKAASGGSDSSSGSSSDSSPSSTPAASSGGASPSAQAKPAPSVWSNLTGANGAGAAIGAGLTVAGAAGGAFQGISQAAKGGGRNITAGIGETALAIAPLTGPAAPFIAGAGAILEGISKLFGDPRAERQKQETTELAALKFNRPDAVNATIDSSGNALDRDYKGNLHSLGAAPQVQFYNQATGFDPLHPDRVVTTTQGYVGTATPGVAAAPPPPTGGGFNFQGLMNTLGQSSLTPQSTPVPNAPALLNALNQTALTARSTAAVPSSPLASNVYSDQAPVPVNTPEIASPRDMTPQATARQQPPPQVTHNTYVSVPVTAMDSKGFLDRADDIGNAMKQVLQSPHPFNSELSRVVNPR